MEINTPTQIKFYWVYLIGFFLILALPLLNVPPWFSPPDWGKTIVFRVILSILIFLFIYQILFQKRYNTFSTTVRNVLRGPFGLKLIFGLLIALFLIFLLATIFSLDPHFSFWGSPYRSGGFLNFAFYIFFALLAFLTLRKSDWQRIWDFSILIGIFVGLVAIFQWQGWLTDILITYEIRPPSTIGGSIFLAIYLLLLSFLTLSFGFREKNFKKKIFYFFALCLFLFVIFLTISRAVYLGVIIGILYFLFFYPKRVIWLKLFALTLLAGGIYGYFYITGVFGWFNVINTPQEFPSFIRNNETISLFISRVPNIADFGGTSRASGWKVSIPVIEERPILGYGPENFSIGFDKYYDSTLPGIKRISGVAGSGWWDKAHNFILDTLAAAGFPALIIYLLLFAVLFWQLQKLKSAENAADNNDRTTKESDRSDPTGQEATLNNKVVYHGIQAAFIGYLAASFLSFDVFSTYLIFFLLIGYSLSLMSQYSDNSSLISSETASRSFKDRSGFRRITTRIYADIFRWRGLIIFLLFIGLIWFVWSFNIKPFQVNKEINWATKYYLPEKNCDKALATMENILPLHSIIDHYLRLGYADVINECFKEKPERKLELAQKQIQILKENIKLRPYYTRNWWFLGATTNFLIGTYQKSGIEEEIIEGLKKEANFYLEKAHQLSPKRQEILIEWAKTDLLSGEFKKAEDKAKECIELNLNNAECYWIAGLVDIYLENKTGANKNLEDAGKRGYDLNSEPSLLQLTNAYAAVKNYQEIIKVYQKLIEMKPAAPQYHASLAAAYKEIGDFEKAREEALIVLKLSPEYKADVEEFLRSLE